MKRERLPNGMEVVSGQFQAVLVDTDGAESDRCGHWHKSIRSAQSCAEMLWKVSEAPGYRTDIVMRRVRAGFPKGGR
jgi:hypothetical protein